MLHQYLLFDFGQKNIIASFCLLLLLPKVMATTRCIHITSKPSIFVDNNTLHAMHSISQPLARPDLIEQTLTNPPEPILQHAPLQRHTHKPNQQTKPPNRHNTNPQNRPHNTKLHNPLLLHQPNGQPARRSPRPDPRQLHFVSHGRGFKTGILDV